MTNKKSTKKALLTSTLCLLLCMSMLVGTTFAWFTDSVSSNNNLITAGNLDVNLYWSTDAQNWAEVNADTNVFMEDTLWEPGHTEVVYLKVVNEGSLALKYDLIVNVASEVSGTNVADESFKLSDYILYNVYEEVKEYDTSDNARGDESGNKLNAPYYKATTLEAGKQTVLTMVAFMPTTVGNEANYKTGTTAPSINLGINLFATQFTKEEDSFGPDYDVNAWHPDMIVFSEADLMAALANGGNIQLGADIQLTEAWTPVGTSEEPFNGVLDGNGHTISGLTISDTDYAALIAYTGENVTVKNLNLEGVDIDSTKHAAGVVCCAGAGLTLENITVSGTIDAASYAGGIVFDADKITIKNCENNATITAGRASGIASWITNATVDNVVNNGDITSSYGSAGIAGRFSGTMTNATNNGTVVGNGSEAVAGIAGIQLDASTYEYCVNNGDVTSTADNANASAAGILGQTPSKKATLNYCINTGNITAEQSYAAGIAYSLYGNISANYCYNKGDVSGADGAGGIAPKAQYGANDTAKYCLNDGTITSSAGKVYQGSNKNTSSYYYDGDVLKNVSDNTEITAKAAKTVLDAQTGGVFFKVIDGRLTASLEYTWTGDVLVNTTDGLQTALDNAVDGDVIVLAANTVFDKVELNPGIAENLTIQGNEGTVVNGIHGAKDTTQLKVIGLTLKDVAFQEKGLYFDAGQGSGWNYVNGVTMTRCSFVGTGTTDDSIGNRLFDVGSDSPGSNQYFNIVIENCTVSNAIQGMRLGGLDGESVIRNNTIDTIGHNAITLRNVSKNGTVLVEGNKISNGGDRAFRIGTNSGSVTYKDNEIINCGDPEDGSNFKANTLGTVTFEGNTVDGADWNPLA